MFEDEYNTLSKAAENKINFLKNNIIGYFLAAMLAGFYVGIGILLIFSIGGQLGNSPFTKVIMGVSFGIALSLVVIAGGELFTGNNLVITGGILNKKISIKDGIMLWLICFLGNWVGSILLALTYKLTGLGVGVVGEFIYNSSIIKTTASPIALFTRGILCNILVCLAIWCTFRCKSESGKLFMIFWCLFAFITTGFEHSIANMTLLTTCILINPISDITLVGYLYNIFIVTFGNMVGAIIFLAIPYKIISMKKEV